MQHLYRKRFVKKKKPPPLFCIPKLANTSFIFEHGKEFLIRLSEAAKTKSLDRE